MDMQQELNRLLREYNRLGISQAIGFEKFAMISIVYNSTKIEGCTLGEGDTRLLIEDGLTAKGKPLTDHMMVQDHYDAFLFLREQAQIKRPLSLKFIQEVNAHVKRRTGGIEKSALGSFNSANGDFRLVAVRSANRYYKSPDKIVPELKGLVRKINARIDQVQTPEQILKLAACLHYHFVDIHPFADGNGRTARLLMNYIQMYHRQPLVKIFTEDRAEYLEALHLVDSGQGIEVFEDFICSQYIKYLNAEIKQFLKEPHKN